LKLQRMLLAGLLTLLTLGCASTTINLPAVTENPSGKQNPGRIIWHDLITDQPAASQRFYSELFGWTFEPVGDLFGFSANNTYTLIRHNGRLIGGMVDENRLPANDADRSQWMVVMSVSDVDAAAQKVQADGGTVMTPPTDIADRGRMAVVADPQGAMLAMLQARGGDPEVREPGYGDFLWDELWTDSVDGATAFYSSVVGYQQDDVPTQEQHTYRILQSDGEPQVGILAHPFEGERPVWATYIRVEDPAAITARVEALGGKIYLEAQDRPLGGTVALIADPSGAGIALQTWPLEKELTR
jgi:predicted enzyme related to lactoylglutathione lyase